MSDVIRFTLNAVLADLRRDLVPAVRDVGDLQRNATLWLAVRAGTSATRSSFVLPAGWRVEQARLSDASYLGALGYAGGATSLDPALRSDVRSALTALMKRQPHTVEGSGFADDPLCAAGLALLAQAFQIAELPTLLANAVATVPVATPGVALALACSGLRTRSFPTFDANAGSLAAAILCSRIDEDLSKSLFPVQASQVAEDRLVQGLCRGRFAMGRGLDAMLTLGALELDFIEDSTRDAPAGETAAPVERTILFLAANPGTSAPLALDEEARAIDTKLRTSEHRDSIRFRTRWAVRPDDLLQALNEDRPTVVHFSGHGSRTRGIVLHDESGGDRMIPGSALKRLFSTMKDDIRVVVLSACYSTDQAREIVSVIDAVIGMSDSVSDGAARVFAAAFYRALGFGRPVQNAFEQGLAAIELEGFHDVHVPELLVKPGVDPTRLVVV